MFDVLVERSQSLISVSEVVVSLAEQAFARAVLSRLGNTSKKAPSTGSLTYLAGSEGVGKSFLARHSIREARLRQPKLSFLMASARDIAQILLDAEDQQCVVEVLDRFDRLNVFVCEDLHSLEGRKEHQNLLLELVDRVYHNGSHVLITSRKLPGELRDFSARWISRCHGGFCAALPSLSRESRIEMITSLVAAQHIPFASPVEASMQWLADRWQVPSQIAKSLDRLAASCQRTSRAVDITYLERWVREESPAEALSLDAITSVVAKEFGLDANELRSRSRQPGLIVPRQCAMFLAREFTGRPLDFIGHYFGDRTHTTVSHSLSRLKELLPNAPTLRQQVQRLRKRLREDCA